ncbi:winged helix-turn-helix transcriptional regulator [Sphingopyxis flava]|uniref:Transcriptional regulator, HxlR family n=1 Tax=Sphingopyxis flava TaxID=1507287 RepID=A0A1T5ANJ5_9SPHN|nr:winged helix-turn-helix transcriptional regulator [Sphingopyxis flava]SKB36183.1 transcriptional regulator, HxlR family [Sphingopyxis flava]
MVEREAYQERPSCCEYRLTAKGKDLFDILCAMRGWAEHWASREGETGGGPAMRYFHRACGADMGAATVCPGCGELLRYGALKGESPPALKAERAGKPG